MARRRFLTTATLITIIIGLAVAVGLLKSGPSGRATGSVLGIGVHPRAEIADTGSVVVDILIPDELRVVESSLSFDGLVFLRDELVSSEVTIDTRELEDGEHLIRLCVATEAYSEDCAEAVIFVQKPSVDVVAYEAPEEIARREVLEITVDTVGEVTWLEADFSAFDSSYVPDDAQVERTESGFRIAYHVNRKADGSEGWHRVPIHVFGADGSRFDFEGPEVFLASKPILPIRANPGTLSRHTVTSDNDWTATAMVAHIDPSLTLVVGNTVLLGVAVEGENLDQAQLLLSMDGFGGHLVVPVAGLEWARTGEPVSNPEGTGYELRTYSVALELIANSAFAENLSSGTIRAAVLDESGRPTQGGTCAAMAQNPSSSPTFFTLSGVGNYTMKAPNGRWTTRSLAAVPFVIRNARGIEVVCSSLGAKGHYQVEVRKPTDSAEVPYTMELVSQDPQIRVSPHTSDSPYTQPVLDFDPTNGSSVKRDFWLSSLDAVPFHIYKSMWRGLRWTESQGAPVQGVNVRWTSGEQAPACVDNSCVHDGEIQIGSGMLNPDDWDIIAHYHELGHIIVAETSTAHSPGGFHMTHWRSEPRLAFNEGLADYIAQMIAGNPWKMNLTLWDFCVKRDINSLSGVHLAVVAGEYSEWVVAAFLWDLQDGLDSSQSDSISGWAMETRNILNTFSNTTDLDHGVPGQVDFADFVYHLACGDQDKKNRVNTLLHDRSLVYWLSEPDFCNP